MSFWLLSLVYCRFRKLHARLPCETPVCSCSGGPPPGSVLQPLAVEVASPLRVSKACVPLAGQRCRSNCTPLQHIQKMFMARRFAQQVPHSAAFRPNHRPRFVHNHWRSFTFLIRNSCWCAAFTAPLVSPAERVTGTEIRNKWSAPAAPRSWRHSEAAVVELLRCSRSSAVRDANRRGRLHPLYQDEQATLARASKLNHRRRRLGLRPRPPPRRISRSPSISWKPRSRRRWCWSRTCPACSRTEGKPNGSQALPRGKVTYLQLPTASSDVAVLCGDEYSALLSEKFLFAAFALKSAAKLYCTPASPKKRVPRR